MLDHDPMNTVTDDELVKDDEINSSR
jgi:hypothetical protein